MHLFHGLIFDLHHDLLFVSILVIDEQPKELGEFRRGYTKMSDVRIYLMPQVCSYFDIVMSTQVCKI